MPLLILMIVVNIQYWLTDVWIFLLLNCVVYFINGFLPSLNMKLWSVELDSIPFLLPINQTLQAIFFGIFTISLGAMNSSGIPWEICFTIVMNFLWISVIICFINYIFPEFCDNVWCCCKDDIGSTFDVHKKGD
eukprot:UN33781